MIVYTKQGITEKPLESSISQEVPENQIKPEEHLSSEPKQEIINQTDENNGCCYVKLKCAYWIFF